MERKKILVNNLLPSKGLEKLYENFEVIAPEQTKFTKEEILKYIPQCQGLLSAAFKIDKDIMGAGVQLEIISNFGAGYDNVDIAYATQKGIMVTNIPNTVTQSTAELTLGLIISLLRRVVEGDRRLRPKIHHAWGPSDFLGDTLAGKTLGIIGMGRIGLATARLAQAFGMEVVYQKRTSYSQEVEDQLSIKHLPFDELLERADVVSLHCPLTPETHHLINEKTLKAMKPSAFLINTARGPVVDEVALLAALKTGVIKGAALDVYEFEPEVTEGLLELDNVILTPHIGSSTLETRTNMTQECVKHLIDYFSGRKPTHIVNPEYINNRNQA
ncbi:MAG: NAD(P)-dependent oxidoreductase [Bacillota bacterium]